MRPQCHHHKRSSAIAGICSLLVTRRKEISKTYSWIEETTQFLSYKYEWCSLYISLVDDKFQSILHHLGHLTLDVNHCKISFLTIHCWQVVKGVVPIERVKAAWSTARPISSNDRDIIQLMDATCTNSKPRVF